MIRKVNNFKYLGSAVVMDGDKKIEMKGSRKLGGGTRERGNSVTREIR